MIGLLLAASIVSCKSPVITWPENHKITSWDVVNIRMLADRCRAHPRGPCLDTVIVKVSEEGMQAVYTCNPGVKQEET